MAIPQTTRDEWLEEYREHRDELLELVKQRYSILAIAISAIGVAFGVAAQSNRQQVVFLMPLIGFILVFSFAHMTLRMSQHYHRLTAYLEVFVEPHLGLGREAHWDQYHDAHKHVAFTKPIMRTYAVLCFVSGLIPLAYWLGVAPHFSLRDWWIAGIEVLVGSIAGGYVWQSWGSAEQRKIEKERWEKVRDGKEVKKGQGDSG